ncbi:MAG TPA: hypothetical protein VN418_00400 [Gammaproteobacteria bacterium]|nr:hypothetical protein [Gammaproteobacteria bacterium]
MNKHRKWTIAVLAVLALFLLLNYAIWKLYTQDLLDHGDGWMVGDLARTGYIPGSRQPRKNTDTLPRRHIKSSEYAGQQATVVTVGDSFSNGIGGGENRFYQDWIASLNGFDVLNVQPLPSVTEIDTIAILLNSGYLKQVGAKHVVMEVVAREIYPTYLQWQKKFDFDETRDLKSLNSLLAKLRWEHRVPKVAFVNSGNLKFVFNTLAYRFDDNAFFSDVFSARLDRPMFTAPEGDRLLFYRNDIEYVAAINTRLDRLEKLNADLNALADRLAQQGIRLYFMPAVDKYDLYAGFLVDNPYPKNAFFESFRKLDKRYTFIDTKGILLRELESGKKDIFHADDTHWNWKASRRIFENVGFQPLR